MGSHGAGWAGGARRAGLAGWDGWGDRLLAGSSWTDGCQSAGIGMEGLLTRSSLEQFRGQLSGLPLRPRTRNNVFWSGLDKLQD